MLADENLEQRIERIRKRDEEIEKKHREAEADRLAALQANAMVKTSAPNDDDWPKAHKYDTIDFTYDVKPDYADDNEKRTEDMIRPQRPFKKFADGEGPPADPSYNFLADSERDGKTKIPSNEHSKKDARTSSNTSPSPSSSSSTTSNFNRQTHNNNSFNRGKNNNNNISNKNRAPPRDRQFDDVRRNDRDRNNDRNDRDRNNDRNDRDRNNDRNIQRQKSTEGNWRQEDKEQKSYANDRNRANERVNKFRSDGNVNNKSARNVSIQQRLGQHPKARDDNLSDKMSDLAIEKRGNATVAVSKDGEVKSVKLDTTRSYGSGRVGSRVAQQPQEQPLQQTVQQPLQQTVQQPVRKPAQQPVQLLDHQPLQQPAQRPLRQPLPQTTQLPLQQPVHHPLQHAVHQPLRQPAYQPVDQTTLDITKKHHEIVLAEVEQYEIQPVPVPQQIVNGVPFKLPSIQERLKKNRVFFDGNTNNQAANENEKSN